MVDGSSRKLYLYSIIFYFSSVFSLKSFPISAGAHIGRTISMFGNSVLMWKNMPSKHVGTVFLLLNHNINITSESYSVGNPSSLFAVSRGGIPRYGQYYIFYDKV